MNVLHIYKASIFAEFTVFSLLGMAGELPCKYTCAYTCMMHVYAYSCTRVFTRTAHDISLIDI